MGGVGTRKGSWFHALACHMQLKTGIDHVLHAIRFEYLLIPLEKTIERTSTESTNWQDIREPSAVGLRFGVGNS